MEQTNNISEEPIPKKKGKDVVIAGWTCFGIGYLLMLMGLGTFIIYAPLFFVVVILSIIIIIKGRIANGVILLLCTLIIPPITFATLIYSNIKSDKLEEKEVFKHLSFEDVEGYTKYDNMYLEGKVRNNGSTTVKFVKVGVEWKDKYGTIIDTDWTYAIGGEGLRPGAAKSFKIISNEDPKMKKFRYYIIE